ncbi:hypothetical protein [Nocardioides aurantiacus]|uniref:hypothetical protein n=1 Tax=Nocardioides aurantiacus TaxID=86796 RepID=UPI00403F5B8F
MGALGMVMVMVVLLLLAGALIASLQVLDRVAGPPRVIPRAPRRAVLVDDRHYPSYGWDLAERAILRTATPGPAPAVEARTVLADTNGSGLHHG